MTYRVGNGNLVSGNQRRFRITFAYYPRAVWYEKYFPWKRQITHNNDKIKSRMDCVNNTSTRQKGEKTVKGDTWVLNTAGKSRTGVKLLHKNVYLFSEMDVILISETFKSTKLKDIQDKQRLQASHLGQVQN